VKFDVVFHYAAMVGVERTQLNPLGVLKDIEGIKNILNLSKETNVKRVFYASSSEVYGEAVSTYQHEITTPLNSRLPYAIVKNVGESFFRSYGEEHGLKYTIFRFFNTYGPLQNNDFVVSRFINKALNNEDIYIYGDGSQSRTFLHINDNISFTLKVLSDDAFINDIVNVGNDKEVTVKELANIIKDMLNSKSKINYIDPLKEGDMQRRRPDIMKMIEFYKKDLISIEDGISLIMQEWNS
jgi:UDP-glucose 4-epimerase